MLLNNGQTDSEVPISNSSLLLASFLRYRMSYQSRKKGITLHVTRASPRQCKSLRKPLRETRKKDKLSLVFNKLNTCFE